MEKGLFLVDLYIPEFLSVGVEYAQSIAKKFRPVVGNCEDEEWAHLRAEPKQG